MSSSATEPVALPFVDEQTMRIEAPRGQVWAGLERYATRIGLPAGSPFATLLGTDPPAGFAVSGSVPQERLELSGRHRFSRYRLTFELTDAPDGATRVHAITHAAFPGWHGRVYRLLVIGSRAHILATHLLLRTVRRLSLRPRA